MSVKAMLDADSRVTTREIADDCDISVWTSYRIITEDRRYVKGVFQVDSAAPYEGSDGQEGEEIKDSITVFTACSVKEEAGEDNCSSKVPCCMRSSVFLVKKHVFHNLIIS